MPFYKVCSAKDISKEKVSKYVIDNCEILLAKSSDNKIWAFNNTCSHADKPLEKGKWDGDTAQITCPFHKAVFSIRENGSAKTPPAFVSLPVYTVDIKIENEEEFVYVDIDQ